MGQKSSFQSTRTTTTTPGVNMQPTMAYVEEMANQKPQISAAPFGAHRWHRCLFVLSTSAHEKAISPLSCGFYAIVIGHVICCVE
jgi:hypothetical protein